MHCNFGAVLPPGGEAPSNADVDTSVCVLTLCTKPKARTLTREDVNAARSALFSRPEPHLNWLAWSDREAARKQVFETKSFYSPCLSGDK